MDSIQTLAVAVSNCPRDGRNHRVYPLSLKASICRAYRMAEKKGEFLKALNIGTPTVCNWLKQFDTHGYNRQYIVTRECVVNTVSIEKVSEQGELFI